jgi:hypothetical protein
VSRWVAAAIAIFIGCSGSRSFDPNEEVVVRVSAVAGLSALLPGLEISGSSAAASDLVFVETTRHIEAMRAEGARIILVRRASAPFSSQQLASALRGKELVSAAALDDRHIEARFADEATAALVVQYQALGFDLGPFEVEQQDENRIRLVRRGESAIDAIELIESTRSDEWRKLLAHELDVVPWAANEYRSHFAGLSSIRVLDIPPNDTAALYFNVRRPALASAVVRRRIAAALNREAIASVACGARSCASEPVAPVDGPALPNSLVVLVPEDVTTFRMAAKVLRHQLWPAGVDLQIHPIAVSEIVRRMTGGDFDVSMLPLSLADHRFGFFLSPGHPKAMPMTGFTSAAYDRAVEQGHLSSAQSIIDSELPATRLFELRSFAAVDSRFCGNVKPQSASWLWLSELYPCEEGPAP